MNNFELRDFDSGANESHNNGKFTVSRAQIVLSVLVAMALIVITGILVAMFGPGSPDLKYHETETSANCKGLGSGKKGKTGLPLDSASIQLHE